MSDKEFNKYKQFIHYIKRDLWYLPTDILYFVLEQTLSAIRRKNDGLYATMTDDELQNNFEKIIEEMNARKEKE
jgi:hypothetical protein